MNGGILVVMRLLLYKKKIDLPHQRFVLSECKPNSL